MHWITYEKIAESTDQWHLDETHYRILEKTRWVVIACSVRSRKLAIEVPANPVGVANSFICDKQMFWNSLLFTCQIFSLT